MAGPVRRIAILGVGFGTDVHLPALRSEGWEVAAIWSRREERAREAAAAHAIPDFSTDYNTLVRRDDIDAVAIATPPSLHHEMTLAALRAGKHVLCEKPFASTAAQAEEMRALARETGLTAMVPHEFRFAPQRAHIKHLIDEGYIGDLRVAHMDVMFGWPTARITTGWLGQAAMGGGVLGALGSHYIDALRHWFGEVASVNGQLLRFTDRGDGSADADDAFAIRLAMQSGGVASITMSATASPMAGARIVLSGSQGTLTATQSGPNPPSDGLVLGGRAGDKALVELPMPPHLFPFDDDRDQRLLPFRLLVREFNRGIDEGTSPAPNFDDGVQVQRVLDAIHESSESGTTVHLA